jgi:hypothetical protein
VTRHPITSALRALSLSSLVALSSLSAGCQISESDIESWIELEKGALRLGGYAVDSARPPKLRERTFELLVQQGHYDALLSVFDQAKSAEDQALWSAAALRLVREYSKPSATTDQQGKAVDVLYYLLSFKWGEEAALREPAQLMWLAEWSISMLKTGQKTLNAVTPDRALTVALLLGGEPISAKLKEHLAEMSAEIPFVTLISNLLLNLRDPKMEELAGLSLMATARRAYPDQINDTLIRALVKTGQLSHLKFLIEVAKDNRAPVDIQAQALKEAGERLIAEAQANDAMRAEVIDLLKRITTSTTSSYTIVFFTVSLLWRLGGVAELASTLKSINPQFNTPVSGADLKLWVENFCEVDVGGDVKGKDEARPVLLALIDELKTQRELWPARLYALTCVHMLYPDDFPRVMREKDRFASYKGDKTKIPAWRSDQNMTLGAIAEGYMSPLGR